MTYFKRFVTLALLVIYAAGVLVDSAYAQQNTDRPLRLALTAPAGLETLQREFGQFQDLLSISLGREVEFFPVASRTAAVEAIKRDKVDFVLAGPAEYVAMRKRAKVSPVVGLYRSEYFSAIIVKSSSDIYKLKDLKGKKIAFGDIGSTSYHLAPLQLLLNGGLEPDRDFKAMNVGKQVAWKAFDKDQVAAIGMGYENFKLFVSKLPGAKRSNYRVIARGPDLPSDVILASDKVSPALLTKMQKVLTSKSDQFINAIIAGGEANDKYRGMHFISDVKDKDYDVIRAMYKSAGFENLG